MEIKSFFYSLESRGLPMAIYVPAQKSEIAVLAIHDGTYILSFKPIIELAKRGFLTAGLAELDKNKSLLDRMLDIKAAVEYLRSLPDVKYVVLFGHSYGGCWTSCYQYIAENGVDRFKNQNRVLPFPDIKSLPPADGLMLVDANYGIMDVLSMDPAVKSLANGFERIPELDLYAPENGYDKHGSHYTEEFIHRFQHAQIQFYENLLNYAKQRMEDIRTGKGRFMDDEPIVIPGAGGGSSNNKLFMQDNRLLSHTRNIRPILHRGGVITEDIARTVRPTQDAVSSLRFHGGSATTTVQLLLENEHRFLNFGYDSCSMWGADWNFNPYSTRANVAGISIPLLCEGNLGSHEFINMEQTFENAACLDKTIIFLAGAQHELRPVESAEAFAGEFGDPAETFADFATQWLKKPGRFTA